MGAIHTAAPQGSSSKFAVWVWVARKRSQIPPIKRGKAKDEGNGREQAEAKWSKMKQSTNNACTKATLKSDFLPVSCFLQATAQSKGKNSEAQQKKRAALPLMVVLLDDQRRISMMFLLIRRSMILPASTLAPSALLPNNKTTKQSRTEHAASALLF